MHFARVDLDRLVVVVFVVVSVGLIGLLDIVDKRLDGRVAAHGELRLTLGVLGSWLLLLLLLLVAAARHAAADVVAPAVRVVAAAGRRGAGSRASHAGRVRRHVKLDGRVVVVREGRRRRHNGRAVGLDAAARLLASGEAAHLELEAELGEVALLGQLEQIFEEGALDGDVLLQVARHVARYVAAVAVQALELLLARFRCCTRIRTLGALAALRVGAFVLSTCRVSSESLLGFRLDVGLGWTVGRRRRLLLLVVVVGVGGRGRPHVVHAVRAVGHGQHMLVARFGRVSSSGRVWCCCYFGLYFGGAIPIGMDGVEYLAYLAQALLLDAFAHLLVLLVVDEEAEVGRRHRDQIAVVQAVVLVFELLLLLLLLLVCVVIRRRAERPAFDLAGQLDGVLFLAHRALLSTRHHQRRRRRQRRLSGDDCWPRRSGKGDSCH